jgi:hypothetical protein
MPSYKPIVSVADLPQVGQDIEHETLDFKARYDLAKPEIRHEIAKDLAMFANHLGGTVLVGAAEDRTSKRLHAWAPLSPQDAGLIQDAAEKALEHLSPRPLLAVSRLPVDGGEVVALNVEPMIGGVVGVRQASHRDSYTFPIRRASQCAWLSPEVLPMYLLPELRRIVIMLERVRGHSNIEVLHWKLPPLPEDDLRAVPRPEQQERWGIAHACSLEYLSLEDNAASFKSKATSGRVALDDIESVSIQRMSPLDHIERTRVVVKLKKGASLG